MLGIRLRGRGERGGEEDEEKRSSGRGIACQGKRREVREQHDKEKKVGIKRRKRMISMTNKEVKGRKIYIKWGGGRDGASEENVADLCAESVNCLFVFRTVCVYHSHCLFAVCPVRRRITVRLSIDTYPLPFCSTVYPSLCTCVYLWSIFPLYRQRCSRVI